MSRTTLRQYYRFALISAALPILITGHQATGVYPFGSYSGGPFDTINNANLNVHFQIPIVNKAGRGLPFSYAITYDGSVWQPSQTSGSTQTWTTVPGTSWGFRAISSVGQTGYVSYETNPTSCSSTSGQPYAFTVYYNWEYHDPLGSTHFFYGAISTYPASGGPCAGSGFPPGTQTGLTASDGSGYSIASISVTCTNSTCPPTYGGLTAANGSQITAPLQQASGPATTVDRNGNEISVSGGVFTDTLNTTALTVAGGGTPASPIRLSYVNASGSTSTYTVNYASYQVQTNFGCSTVGDTNAGQQYLISSITLPDGTSYTFTYEPTPSFSGYTTGRLASVKLPAAPHSKITFRPCTIAMDFPPT